MTRALRVLVVLAVIASMARANDVTVDDEPKVPPKDRVTDGPFGMVQVTLPNDLGIILVPEPNASSVVVHLRYESGSASERPGEEGFAHVVEGLLGMASAHRSDFVAQIEGLGGWTTAATATDHIGTTTQIPAHALDRVLWLEAERMAGLVDGIKPLWLARAKERTQAAWRAAYVDAPYGLVDRELSAKLSTGQMTAYGRPVLGDGKAVASATVAQLKAFARRRIVPNNAMLVIAGRIDVAATRKLVERYFGWMPPRYAPHHAYGGHPRTERDYSTIRVASRIVVVGYTMRPLRAEVAAAAYLLAGDRESRLYRRLVVGGLASDVRAEVTNRKNALDELRIYATPLPGVDPQRVASSITAEVRGLGSKPTDAAEVERVAARVELDFFLAAENLAVRAELLAATSSSGEHTPSIFEWWPKDLRELRAKHSITLRAFYDGPVIAIGPEDAR